MDEYYLNKRKYWDYQFRLGQEYLIPFLQRSGYRLENKTVLDIGCAEGGLLAALTLAGAKALGIEISPSRLQWAGKIAAEKKVTVDYIAADIFHSPLKPRTFDLIILRDVIEHLPDKGRAMAGLAAMMSESSLLLLTFPPFYSPFGGHQQMLQSFWRRIPYFHVLPKPFWRVARNHIEGRDANKKFLMEMENLRRHRLSNHTIKKLCSEFGLQVIRRAYYISRPSYKLRYGWPVIRAGFLARMPFLNEVLVSGVTLLLQKR